MENIMNTTRLMMIVLLIMIMLPIAIFHAAAQEREAPQQRLITNVDIWDGTSDNFDRR